MSTPTPDATATRDVVAELVATWTTKLAANKDGLPLALRVLIPQLAPKLADALRSVERGALTAEHEREVRELMADVAILLERGAASRAANDAAVVELMRDLPTAGEA